MTDAVAGIGGHHAMLIFLVSAAACAFMIRLLGATLPGSFLAVRSEARSNHRRDARQLGGLALAPVTLVVAILFAVMSGIPVSPVLVTAGAVMFATGFLDDRYHLPVALRFLVQLFCAAICVDEFTNLAYGEILGSFAALALVFLLVFWTNAVNFMDGLDLMTVAGLGIPLGFTALVLLANAHGFSAILAVAITGSLVGFALWNRPPARIFLGDSGSLFLGVCSGALVLAACRDISIWVMLTPFWYYLADTLTTLFLRLKDGENITTSHSRHAYQVAYRSGWPVTAVIGATALLNLFLAVLSSVALLLASHAAAAMAFVLGGIATFMFLYRMRLQT